MSIEFNKWRNVAISVTVKIISKKVFNFKEMKIEQYNTIISSPKSAHINSY